MFNLLNCLPMTWERLVIWWVGARLTWRGWAAAGAAAAAAAGATAAAAAGAPSGPGRTIGGAAIGTGWWRALWRRIKYKTEKHNSNRNELRENIYQIRFKSLIQKKNDPTRSLTTSGASALAGGSPMTAGGASAAGGGSAIGGSCCCCCCGRTWLSWNEQEKFDRNISSINSNCISTFLSISLSAAAVFQTDCWSDFKNIITINF